MPEETTETRVISLLSRMEERQEAGFEQMNVRFNGLEQRMARLEGGFEQMDKRMSKTETDVSGLRADLKSETTSLRTEIGDLRKDMRQVLFVVIGTWVTVMITLLLKSS